MYFDSFPLQQLLSAPPHFHAPWLHVLFLSVSYFQAKQKARNKTKILQKETTKKITKIKVGKGLIRKEKKKTPTQNETKRAQKYHRVHLGLANSCWARGLPWVLVDKPSDTSLEKTGFSLCQHVKIAASSALAMSLGRNWKRQDQFRQVGGNRNT